MIRGQGRRKLGPRRRNFQKDLRSRYKAAMSNCDLGPPLSFPYEVRFAQKAAPIYQSTFFATNVEFSGRRVVFCEFFVLSLYVVFVGRSTCSRLNTAVPPSGVCVSTAQPMGCVAHLGPPRSPHVALCGKDGPPKGPVRVFRGAECF